MKIQNLTHGIPNLYFDPWHQLVHNNYDAMNLVPNSSFLPPLLFCYFYFLPLFVERNFSYHHSYYHPNQSTFPSKPCSKHHRCHLALPVSQLQAFILIQLKFVLFLLIDTLFFYNLSNFEVPRDNGEVNFQLLSLNCLLLWYWIELRLDDL